MILKNIVGLKKLIGNNYYKSNYKYIINLKSYLKMTLLIIQIIQIVIH